MIKPFSSGSDGSKSGRGIWGVGLGVIFGEIDGVGVGDTVIAFASLVTV